jgi:hypothetical protein
VKKLLVVLFTFIILISGCAVNDQAKKEEREEVENSEEQSSIVTEKYQITEHQPLQFDFNQQIAVKYAIVALKEFDQNTNQQEQLNNFNTKNPVVSSVIYEDQNHNEKRIVLVMFKHLNKEEHYAATRLLLNQDKYFDIKSRGYHVSDSIKKLINQLKKPAIKVSETGEQLNFVVLEDLPADIEEAVGYVGKLRGFGVLKREGEESYIYIGSGERSTGGYDIAVEDVRRIDDLTRIKVNETSPDPDDPVTTALTYPKVVIKVDNATMNVEVINDEGDRFENINDERSESDYYE